MACNAAMVSKRHFYILETHWKKKKRKRLRNELFVNGKKCKKKYVKVRPRKKGTMISLSLQMSSIPFLESSEKPLFLESNWKNNSNTKVQKIYL